MSSFSTRETGKARARDERGRFVKEQAEEAIESLETITKADEDENITKLLEQLREQVNLAEEQIEELNVKQETIGGVLEIEEYKKINALRKVEKEREEYKKKVAELAERVAILDKLRGVNLEESPDVEIKVAKPEPYDGKSEGLLNFLNSCELVFQGYPKKYAQARSRILYVLSFMTKGSAETWRNRVLNELEDVLVNIATIAEAKACNHWEAFKHFMKKSFKNITAEMEAQTKLQRIRQLNETVQEFSNRFHLTAIDAGLDDKTLAIFYRAALKPVIKRRIYDSGEIPETLNEWETRAKKIDVGWMEGQLMMNESVKRTTGQIRSTEPRRERLSDAEFERRKKERLCFKCGKGGHMSRSCFAKNRTVTEETTQEGRDEQSFQ